MRYTRLHADRDGVSHFEDLEIELAPVDFAPPAGPLDVSAPVDTKQCLFASVPDGWEGDWHPAPRRQFWLQLAGQLEVEAGDGEVRRFAPGAVVLLEDVTGKGHVTRTVGGSAMGAFVQLE